MAFMRTAGFATVFVLPAVKNSILSAQSSERSHVKIAHFANPPSFLGLSCRCEI